MADNPMLVESRALSDLAGIRHGFFTRAGGVSRGLYASLNCGPGSQDDAAAVAENRSRAMQALGLPVQLLCTLYQVHGDTVVPVGMPFAQHQRPKADAMVSNRAGITLGVLTADCVPVLLADPEARIVGAAHAGWKGALAGIVDNAVGAMERMGAQRQRIVAAIGPCIRQESYEVGPEFPRPFIAASAANEVFFTPSQRAGYHQFDLAGYVASRLAGCGVETVDDLGLDTRADEVRFFSYRRSTLAKEADYGRQLSAIAVAP